MLQKLKKIPSYAFKLAKEKNFLEIASLIRHVKPKHLLIALAAYVDKRSTAVELHHNLGMQDILFFLKILSYRGQRLRKDFYLWNYGKRCFCATYMQFIGLNNEYLSGQFDNLYAYDWKDKVVLDIGGFVGDSALYFLDKGAHHVIIYEPLPENIFALNYNLHSYKDKISIHQKAVSKKEGLLTLSSNTPAGSPEFGMEKGRYQISCIGITLKQILNKHRVDVAKIDCEGGEAYIIDIPKSDLQAIPYWIVETHSLLIEIKVRQKFKREGFSVLTEITLNPRVKLLHFKKVSN
jgi:FkbM family methyltransferase